MNYNKIILVGRLTHDPEESFTPDGIQKTTFGLAVSRPRSRDGVDETDFFRITTWRKLAENCSRYLSKGRLVLVEGTLRPSKWTTKEGQERTTLDVTAGEVRFLEKMSQGSGDYAPSGPPREEKNAAPKEDREPEDKEDIPF